MALTRLRSAAEAGKTARVLGKEIGVDHTTVARWIAGTRSPKGDNLRLLIEWADRDRAGHSEHGGSQESAFYDGILHALAVYNRASGELIAEVQAWRGKQPPTVTPDDLQAADDGIRAREELEAKINQAKRSDGSTKAG